MANAVSGKPVAIECYGTVARAVHWAVAALAVIAVALGCAIPGALRGTESRDVLLILHRSVGLLILGLMVFRIVWRWSHPPPPLPSDVPRLESWAANADHLSLYVMFLVMPLSGYLNAAAAGHAVSFFGLFTIPPLMAFDPSFSQAAIALHLAGQFAIYALVAVHVTAALTHRFVKRNHILDRMLPMPRRA